MKFQWLIPECELLYLYYWLSILLSLSQSLNLVNLTFSKFLVISISMITTIISQKSTGIILSNLQIIFDVAYCRPYPSLTLTALLQRGAILGLCQTEYSVVYSQCMYCCEGEKSGGSGS